MQVVIALFLAAALFVFAAGDLFRGAIEHPPGELVEVEPQQQETSMRGFTRGDYTIIPVARYRIEARVLGIERYRFDREADIAPWDLAVGWGPMSDSAVLDRLDVRQRDRFFFWHADTLPIPRDLIEGNAANMHLIPADDAVESVVADARPGQLVRLEGYLVNVSAKDGWRWRTSLTRHDVGGGACELMYVEQAVLQ